MRTWLEQFNALPANFKLTLCAVLVILIVLAGVFGINNWVNSARVERLEQQNTELSKKAADLQSEMEAAALRADLERKRSEMFKEQLAALTDAAEKQDEKVKTTLQRSSDIRRDIERVRIGPARSTNEPELRRRLESRYSRTENSEPLQ